MKCFEVEIDKTLSESVLLQEKQLNSSVRCKNGNLAHLVCISKKCIKTAFICLQKRCPCRTVHKKCFKIVLEQFTQKIESKILSVDSYIDFHYKKADSFIDTIIDEASKIKQQFKNFAEQKYKYCMLSQTQHQVFMKLKENKVEDMSGQYCNQLFMEMDDYVDRQYQKLIQEQLAKIEQEWKKVEDKCKLQLVQLTKQLSYQIFKPVRREGFEYSSIVKQQEEKKVIAGFFDKQIKKVKLMYKASENQFKLERFYSSSTGISNTITLIETQFGKKIGGFTPLRWKQVQETEQLADSSNSSFIFSLSNNQKFKQTDSQSGISNSKDKGPYFRGGSSYDIAISNQGDKNDCVGDFNFGYIHPNYTIKNSQTHKNFSGNPNNTYKFKAKQWQVWKVQFK